MKNNLIRLFRLITVAIFTLVIFFHINLSNFWTIVLWIGYLCYNIAFWLED